MRLINAEDVIIRLHVDPEEWGTPDERWRPEHEYAMAIMTSPEIDPVKHGWWVKMSDIDGIYYACSECGEELTRIKKFDPQFDLFPKMESIDKTHYCPHCGAKMDEEGV